MTAQVRGVYLDPDFRFNDGEVGRKLFVVLADCEDHYLAVKTTTQRHGRSITQGCNLADYWQNYYIPAGRTALNEPTWIDLQEIYILRKLRLDASIAAGLITLQLLLPKPEFVTLLTCAEGGDGVTATQALQLTASRVANHE